MFIRPYESVDAPKLRLLLEAFQCETGNHLTASRQAILALRDLESAVDMAVVAEDKHRLVGFQAGHRYRNDADEFRAAGTIELAVGYVVPEKRRLGIAKLLASRFMQESSSIGITAFLTCIEERNKAPLTLFRKQGFEEVGSYQDGRHTYLVLKKSV